MSDQQTQENKAKPSPEQKAAKPAPVQVLKGNFTPRQPVNIEPAEEDLTTQFEREALKRLGGSIAFVSKKKFLFGLDEKKRDDNAG